MEHIFFLAQTTARKIDFREPHTLNFQISSKMGTVSYTVPSKVAQYVIQRHPDISIYTAQLHLDAPADGAVYNTEL